MRALLFLAVFALATQVHMSELTEFYRTFLTNIPMDTENKNILMNQGLDCLNHLSEVVVGTVNNIQYDLGSKDYITALRHLIASEQVLEKMVVPQCIFTAWELSFYIQHEGKFNNKDSNVKYFIFQSRLVQLLGQVAVDALNKQPNAAAKDLAVFISTAAGLMDPQLPTVLELDYSKYVEMNDKVAIPQFLKGFFTEIGITDLAKINGTSQCALDIIETIKIVATNPALQRGDFYTRANAFLDSFMNVTDSFERCKKLNTVDTPIFEKLVRMFKQYPALSIIRVFANTIMDLPHVAASEFNMNIYMLQGQYELAGRLYAQNLRTQYNGVMF